VQDFAQQEAVPSGAPGLSLPQPERQGLADNLNRSIKKQTLGMHLTELQGEDPRCVFIVRRVSSMGFQSQELLATHFSQWGMVTRVLVAHSKVKPFRCSGNLPRIRPGSLGFVVMDSVKSVKNILAAGKEQMVADCLISVEPFEQCAKSRDPCANVALSGTDSTSTATGDTRGSGSGPDSGSGSGSGSGSQYGCSDDKSGSQCGGSDDKSDTTGERMQETPEIGSTDKESSEQTEDSGTEAVGAG